MKAVTKLFLFFAFVATATAQFTAGTFSTIEPRYIVDLPTAGVLRPSVFALDFDFFQQGGVAMSVQAGALENFNLGVSFGGKEVIGSRKIIFQKFPGIFLKYRFLDEKKSNPAFAIGFDMQGKDAWVDSTERFTIKSRGFYIVASRNYSYFGNLSLHMGANYSLEKKDKDISPNIFFGVEKSLGTNSAFLLEYDFALNDDEEKSLGGDFGYLNTGLRWSLGNGFTIELDFKDLLLNQKEIYSGNRTMRIEFIRNF